MGVVNLDFPSQRPYAMIFSCVHAAITACSDTMNNLVSDSRTSPKSLPSPLVFSAIGIGLFALSLLGAFLAGDAAQWWWHAGTLAAAFLIVMITRTAFGRTWLPIVFGIVTGGVIVWAGIGYVGEYFGAGYANKIHQITNRNIIASAMAMNGFLIVWLFPRLRLATVPITTVAVLASNSRTATFAFLFGLVMLLLYVRHQRGKRDVWIVAAVGVVIGAAVLLGPPQAISWIDAQLVPGKNLVKVSTDIRKSPWRTTYNRTARVEPADIAGPERGGAAQRIRTTYDPDAQYPSIAVIQSIERSIPDQSYVVSAWFRADEPMTLVLGTNFTRATCEVSTEWNRCVAPSFIGNDHGQVQIRFEYPKGVEELDFYVWGPQVEYGDTVTPIEHTDDQSGLRTLQRQLTRFDISSWGADRSVTSRQAGWLFAFEQFTLQPIAGHGITTFRVVASGYEAAPRIDHAHNLILDILFERGLIGLVVVIASIVAAAWYVQAEPKAVVVLVLFLLVLDSANFVFYTSGVYYSFFIGLGLLPLTRVPAGKET